MPRRRGIKADYGGGALDVDDSWHDVRPLHVNDHGARFDSRRVQALPGHNPTLTRQDCETCGIDPNSVRTVRASRTLVVETPEEREARLSQGWDEAMSTARANER